MSVQSAGKSDLGSAESGPLLTEPEPLLTTVMKALMKTYSQHQLKQINKMKGTNDRIIFIYL